MPKHLFDPDLLDRLEGLNERYALLSRRIEVLQDEATAYDRPPDPEKLATFETLRHKVKAEVAALLEGVFRELGSNGWAFPYALNGWDEKPATLPRRSTVRPAKGHSVAQKGAWHETVYSSRQIGRRY